MYKRQVLYLTHGITMTSTVAVLGTLASLVLTGVLAAVSVSALRLSGITDDVSSSVSDRYGITMSGLLVASIIIGSVGVLDGVLARYASGRWQFGAVTATQPAPVTNAFANDVREHGAYARFESAREARGLAAQHYERAGDPVQACRFYTRAAEDAAARYANSAMLTFVERALALADPADHETRWRAHLVRERHLLDTTERAAHDADLQALADLAEQLDDEERRIVVSLRRAATLRGAGDYAGAEAAGRHGPVSYTHLRAHETVLALVCRLLLEQKKLT